MLESKKKYFYYLISEIIVQTIVHNVPAIPFPSLEVKVQIQFLHLDKHFLQFQTLCESFESIPKVKGEILTLRNLQPNVAFVINN